MQSMATRISVWLETFHFEFHRSNESNDRKWEKKTIWWSQRWEKIEFKNWNNQNAEYISVENGNSNAIYYVLMMRAHWLTALVSVESCTLPTTDPHINNYNCIHTFMDSVVDAEYFSRFLTHTPLPSAKHILRITLVSIAHTFTFHSSHSSNYTSNIE